MVETIGEKLGSYSSSKGEPQAGARRLMPLSGGAKDTNSYRVVNQMGIEGRELRIPDGTLCINGLPLVVLEFKNAIRENATLDDAGSN
ncbi:MAG: type I restriction endonuclease [Rubripirellula sp.]